MKTKLEYLENKIDNTVGKKADTKELGAFKREINNYLKNVMDQNIHVFAEVEKEFSQVKLKQPYKESEAA